MSDNKAIDFLIVNKNKDESQDMVSVIEKLGLNVVACLSNGQSAIDTVKEKKVDVALIDVDLKDSMDGIECAQILKNNFNTKSIILSDYEDEEILTSIIDLEPESFYIKPFREIDLKIAISLLKSKFKREMKVDKKIDLKKEITKIKIDGYFLNLMEKKLYFDGDEISLSNKEYKLVELFFKYPDEIISYSKIKAYIWKDKKMNKNSLINLISSLRKKLKNVVIKNINTQGYFLGLR